MGLIDELLASMPPQEIPVRDVRIGVHWTAVCSLTCGLAATFTGNSSHGSQRVRDVGNLQHKSAQELASWLRSDNLLEASIGLAALNSLTKVDEKLVVEINAFDLLSRLSGGKNIAVVGHFPQVEQLARSARAVWVIEKHPQPGDFPAEAAADLIPKADIVAITGTTLINHTLEGLLALCSQQAPVILIGPSTPLLPLLFDRGIRYLSGTVITDENAALRTIQQGAVFPQVQGTRLVTLSRNHSR